MTSFRQISAQGSALVIDAASSLVQVGLIGPGAAVRWETSADESGVAIFQCIERLGIAPQDVPTLVFCEGPGSVLGIRTAAMAVRTWGVLRPRPVFAYCSLAVVAHALGRPGTAVIADARRGSWHHYRIGSGLHRMTVIEPSEQLFMPENFRHWSALPPSVATVPYRLAELVPCVADCDLLRETVEPDAFLHEEPSYVMWTPQIHRSPVA